MLMERVGVGIRLMVVFGVALGIYGCRTVVMQTAQVALEDRTTEDQVTDAKIKAGILFHLEQKDMKLLLDVTSDVWEQRVLLTGTLDNFEVRQEVVNLVKTDTRIQVVYDEIQIVSTEEKEQQREQKKKQEPKEEGGSDDTIDDYWISGKIKVQLLKEAGVRAVNYRWHTVRHMVYIIGRARDYPELIKVLEICRTTEGVKNVIPFIEVKPIEPTSINRAVE